MPAQCPWDSATIATTATNVPMPYNAASKLHVEANPRSTYAATNGRRATRSFR